MDAKDREIRTVECQLAIREATPEGDEKGESRTITGTAIVFNAESQVLDDWGGRYREVIAPEAATMEFLLGQDIKMNMLHDRSLTIARSNKGVGNLKLSVDERGVNFEFDAPKCDLGDRALELVRSGVYSGCSFEFYPDGNSDEVKSDGGDVTVIRHHFRAITALTLGMDPAYMQTSVNVREMWKKTPEGKAEMEARRIAHEREVMDAQQAARERELDFLEYEI